eukprot:gene24051-43675_t
MAAYACNVGSEQLCNGDRRCFWRSRAPSGDPLACRPVHGYCVNFCREDDCRGS